MRCGRQTKMSFGGRTRRGGDEGAADEWSVYSGGDEERGPGLEGTFMSSMEVEEI